MYHDSRNEYVDAREMDARQSGMPAARTPPTEADGPLASIAEVERLTGLPRATIRIWERRYGYPAPLRDARGERCYTPDQVEQLRLMRRLVEQGHRPARLVASGPGELQKLAQQALPAPVGHRRSRNVTQLLQLLRAHDEAAVRDMLEATLKQAGLEEFAAGEVPLMNLAIGDAWLAGELQVFEEHLYSDCLSDVMREAIARVAPQLRPEAPRVLLTTFPQEPHGLGLLVAHALFALQGCPVVSLGVRLPVGQIAAAVEAYDVDLVGLSFTESMNPGHVLRGLEELRGMLPVSVRIWAGGAAPVLGRRPVTGVRVVRDVRHVPAALAEDFALPPRRGRA
jgi:DNA-binding transcriptional MerR regulator/methylmalonyl-CoA mutase cobalamin-binding subunit